MGVDSRLPDSRRPRFIGHRAGGRHRVPRIWTYAVRCAPVELVSIGIGPVLWHCRIGETRFELRSVPCAGFVRCDPPIVNRLSRLLFLLGGVLGNVVLIVVVSAIRSVVVPDPEHDYVGPIAFVQYYYIIVNLVPFWTTAGGVRTGSDGLQLLLLACGTMSGTSSRDPNFLE